MDVSKRNQIKKLYNYIFVLFFFALHCQVERMDCSQVLFYECSGDLVTPYVVVDFGQNEPNGLAPNRRQVTGLPTVTEFQYFVKEMRPWVRKFFWILCQNTEIFL